MPDGCTAYREESYCGYDASYEPEKVLIDRLDRAPSLRGIKISPYTYYWYANVGAAYTDTNDDTSDYNLGEPFIPVNYDATSSVALNDGSQRVVDMVVTFVREDAIRRNVSLSKIDIRGLLDPSDDTTQVIVQVWTCGLSTIENDQYFRDLCNMATDWLAGLNQSDQDIFYSEFILQSKCA